MEAVIVSYPEPLTETQRIGEWLSLVERLVWDQDVAGSNPVSPTIFFVVLNYRVGEWLSLVERLVWDQDVAGSNPVSPTISFSVQHFS